MIERRTSEGVKGLVKIFAGALVLGLLSSTTVGASRGIALHFAMVMSMLYCAMYVACKAAHKDLGHKEGSEVSGSNKIIDGR